MVVLDGVEFIGAEGARLVRLRLLFPLLGTAGALDGVSDDIVDE